MNNRITTIALAVLMHAASALHAGGCCHAAVDAPSAPAPLPDTSLYHAEGRWVDQNGRPCALRDFAGTPVLVSMIFTHCGYACPRTVADLRALREALPADVRGRVRVVLASFDVERDTPGRLREWASMQELGPEWSLLHGDENAVRELAVMLDIAFQRQPDGSFAHANRIVLLDASGVPVDAIVGLGVPADSVIANTMRLASAVR